MCKVKTGSQVRTISDLQDLVTSVILRQPRPFTAESIKLQVQKYLAGSPLLGDDSPADQVGQLCERTMQYMAMSKGIRSIGMGEERYRLTLAFPSFNPTMMDGE